MPDYEQVQVALSNGIAPAMICSGCPWHRPCITPPEMTKSQVDQKLQESQQQIESGLGHGIGDADDHAEGRGLGALMGTLMTTMFFSGKDLQATVCPVLVARMQGSDGRKIADNIRAQMQGWDDSEVTI